MLAFPEIYCVVSPIINAQNVQFCHGHSDWIKQNCNRLKAVTISIIEIFSGIFSLNQQSPSKKEIRPHFTNLSICQSDTAMIDSIYVNVHFK